LLLLEVVNKFRSGHLTTKSSWLQSAKNVVKDPVKNVVRDFDVDVVGDVAIEAAGGLLGTLAELISTPSIEL
jgi:hypothetical protein